ncbi:MAG: neutral ceramidase [Flavobacteriales bacterium]|jgi:neutral ceramidase
MPYPIFCFCFFTSLFTISNYGYAESSELDSLHERQFFAGFNMVEISPVAKRDLLPTILSTPKIVSTVHESIYLRSMVLTNGESSIAIVSLDLKALPDESFKRIKLKIEDELNIDLALISVTHTHSGAYDKRQLANLESTIVTSVKQAQSQSIAVKLGLAQAQAFEGYNRIIRNSTSSEMLWTNPDKKPNRAIDNTLNVIELRTLDDKPFISIINYNAHPVVTMDLNDVVISPDYPGHLINAYEQQNGGRALFLLSAAGDVNPFDANTAPTALALQKSRQLGERLAKIAAGAANTITHYEHQGTFSYQKKTFDYPPAEISAGLLGNELAFACFPGEYFNEFSDKLRKNSTAKMSLFIGYCNGYIGYVPTEEATHYGGLGANLKEIQAKKDTGKTHTDFAAIAIENLIKQRRYPKSE